MANASWRSDQVEAHLYCSLGDMMCRTVGVSVLFSGTSNSYASGICVGKCVTHREDAAILSDRAEHTAEIKLPGIIKAAFLRSPFALGTVSIDVSRALALPGAREVMVGRIFRTISNRSPL